MKWTLYIENKLKVAMFMACIMFFVILSSIFGKMNMRGMNDSVNSIYNDRLIPATDIFYLSENLYNKRLLLEKTLFSPDAQIPDVRKQLSNHNTNIKQLINQYEHTYLVNRESEFLNQFKAKASSYAQMENSVLALIERNEIQAAQQLYNDVLKLEHAQVIRMLDALIKIQSEVGKELIQNSEFRASSFNLWSTLQMITAILIGGLIFRLIIASKIMNIKQEKFTLN